MDQGKGDIRQHGEGTRAAMTEKSHMVEERVQETAAEVKSAVESAMEGFKQVQETVAGAQSAVEHTIDTVKETVDGLVDRVKGTADLLEQVQQAPWTMLGSAILLGYILGSLGRK